jgi:galactose mutarotase-like enzyme
MIGRPEWEVVALGRGRVRARFDLGTHPELLASFPFPHVVTVDVRAGRRRVQVHTMVEAGPDGAVPIAFGWHPYWRLPGPRDDWELHRPAAAHARLDRRGIPTGRARPEPVATGPLHGAEYDDLYALAADRTVTLRGGDRLLRLELDDGYPFLQVFAPASGSFCCLEPMTAPTNALVTGDHPTLHAGATFGAAFTATVRPERVRA